MIKNEEQIMNYSESKRTYEILSSLFVLLGLMRLISLDFAMIFTDFFAAVIILEFSVNKTMFPGLFSLLSTIFGIASHCFFITKIIFQMMESKKMITAYNIVVLFIDFYGMLIHFLAGVFVIFALCNQKNDMRNNKNEPPEIVKGPKENNETNEQKERIPIVLDGMNENESLL